jgi:putative peptide zinc metalloprotease protein
LCPSCHRRVDGAGPCRRCAGGQALELLLPDGTRVALTGDTTIGRAADSVVVLDDPAVSRHHARIVVAADGPVLEDAGSRYGTWLDGRRVDGRRPLRDGATIRVGDQQLVVERPRGDDEAGRTIVVPVRPSPTLDGGEPSRPRPRAGYALKRLAASEGDRRWVVRDLERNRFLRMSDRDAELFRLLDGRRTLPELIVEAERRGGASGPARLARLLAELADRGLLEGGPKARDAPAPGGLRRLVVPREWVREDAGRAFERLYRGGGWRLFTRPALAGLALLVVAGLLALPYLIVARYGTPFVVAHRVGVGALIFLLGRLAVVAVHETAHGLTMASFGRRVQRAGVKLVLVFPYAFVDTSEAWFEPRRRRIAVTAAGPVSDLSLGALFALGCLALPAGSTRDILFQLAFAAYVGACFNLNPFVERDGYQILVDALREPGLRRRARAELLQWIGGQPARDAGVLVPYAVAGIAWSAVAGAFATAMSLRYRPRLAELVPDPVVWAAMATLWLGFFLPVIATVAALVRARLGRASEA